jgi:beta-galactosidase
VADVFRIPKLGASFYQSQVSPAKRVVIAPDFYWDFGPQSPHRPDCVVFSNCDRLELFINGKHVTTAMPNRKDFTHLKYPPFFCGLTFDDVPNSELRIDGYIGAKLALSKSFSSDRTKDQFFLAADDQELIGDGSDATRLFFQTVDRFGALRPFAGGTVELKLTGPGVIVGDNPFQLADSGGVGAVWIKTLPKSSGRIVVTATHSLLGSKSATIKIQRT